MKGYQSPCKDLTVTLHEIGINHYKIGIHWRALKKGVIYFLKDYSGCFVEKRMESSSWESGRSEISQKALKSFLRGMMVPWEKMIVLDVSYSETNYPQLQWLITITLSLYVTILWVRDMGSALFWAFLLHEEQTRVIWRYSAGSLFGGSKIASCTCLVPWSGQQATWAQLSCFLLLGSLRASPHGLSSAVFRLFTTPRAGIPGN